LPATSSAISVAERETTLKVDRFVGAGFCLSMPEQRRMKSIASSRSRGLSCSSTIHLPRQPQSASEITLCFNLQAPK
jgi:hypothetical protein